MSVPPDMLARIGQQRGGELPGGGQPGPAGTPMATPSDKSGKEEIAKVQVHVAMNMLEQALVTFMPDSPEYKTVLKNLTSLAKQFGENDATDLIPAQMKQLVGGMPQTGGGSDAQKQIMQMMKGGGQPPQAGGGMPPQMPQM